MFQTIGDTTPAAGSRELRTFTITVGRRETPADFYASDVKVCQMSDTDENENNR